MRWVTTKGMSYGIIISISLAATGCSSPGLLLGGVGDQPYIPPDTEERVLSARSYFDLMCLRTGKTSCSRADWNDIVMTALNDIDERCGQYLESLDAARRNKGLWSAALTDIGASTKTIFALTNPASIKAMTIVEAAFDLAKTSIAEYYSAAIMAEEPSIVQRIVRKLQTQYRLKLSDKLKDKFMDRGSAHYVVRGYLRLCLPITVEAELKAIKTNVTYTAEGTRFTIAKDAPVLQTLDAIPTLRTAQ